MRRLLITAAATAAALLGLAGPAAAHNTLVGSDPADGARLDTGPAEVRLTFDQPVRTGAGYNTITVVGPGGGQWTAGQARVEGNSVLAPVRELGPAGDYAIGYRVLSNDGHPVTGKVSFTLTRAGGGTPAPAPQAEPDGSGGGMPVWPWIAGAAVLVVLGLVLALRLGRPSGSGD